MSEFRLSIQDTEFWGENAQVIEADSEEEAIKIIEGRHLDVLGVMKDGSFWTGVTRGWRMTPPGTEFKIIPGEN